MPREHSSLGGLTCDPFTTKHEGVSSNAFHPGTDVTTLLLPGDQAPVEALLQIRGPVSSRARRRFERRLAAQADVPPIVVEAAPLGADEPSPVAGPVRALARSLGAGRDTPRCVLFVEGRRVWEHHGLRRSHLPDPREVARRARTLRGFTTAERAEPAAFLVDVAA